MKKKTSVSYVGALRSYCRSPGPREKVPSRGDGSVGGGALAGSANAGTTQFYDGDGIAPWIRRRVSGIPATCIGRATRREVRIRCGIVFRANTAAFNGGGSIQINGDVTAAGLDFRGGNYSITQLGGILTLDSFDINNPPTLNVDTGFYVELPHSAVGGSGFTKTGGGTVYFSRRLTDGGPVNINQGTVAFSLSAADFQTAHAMTIGANGTFDMGVINDGFGSLAGSGTVKTTPILVGGDFRGVAVDGRRRQQLTRRFRER